jgi:ankyrin repeat protein
MADREALEREFLRAVAEDQDKAAAMIAADRSLLLARYTWGGTALSYAVIENWIAGVKCLLERGADPNLPDDLGDTPLMYAVEQDLLECMKLLLAHGADPRAKTLYGDAILSHAVWPVHAQAAELLLAAGARLEDISELHLAFLDDEPEDQREAMLAVLRAHGWKAGTEST